VFALTVSCTGASPASDGCVMRTLSPVSTSRSALAISFAEGNRPAGSRHAAFANQASNPSGTDAILDGIGIGLAQIWMISTPRASPSNGLLPTRHSNAMIAIAQRSARKSISLFPSACSGLM
jgi:hypothetical protein